MREDWVVKSLNFIHFVFKSANDALSKESEELALQLLEQQIEIDQALLSVIESYSLTEQRSTLRTNDGCYPDTTIFINRFGIKDEKLLHTIEGKFVAVRLAQLLFNTVPKRLDFNHLTNLHLTLLGDLYPFAGKLRTIAVVKNTLFCLPPYIKTMGDEIFSNLEKENYLKGIPKEQFIERVAYYMGELYALHPFLDGNTRVFRLYFYQLAQKAGWDFDTTKISTDSLRSGDFAAVEGEYKPLIELLKKSVIELKE